MTDPSTSPSDVSRRDALKRAGLVAGGAAAVWAAPSVTTLGRAFAEGSTAGTTYVLKNSFDGTQNPAGQFTFLQPEGVLVHAFNLPGRPDLLGFGGDHDVNGDAGFPFILRNNGGPTTYGTLTIDADSVFGHPGQPGAPLTIQFTAPTAGSYTVAGTLKDFDGQGGDGINFTVNSTGTGASVSGGYFDGGSAPLSGSFTLAAGGTISVTIDPKGTYFNDSTGIDLTITGP